MGQGHSRRRHQGGVKSYRPLAAIVPERVDRTARAHLLDLINASWTTQAIATTVELRIADLLAAGPRDIEDLARESACHAPSLERLIGALASLDLVEQRGDGMVALTTTGTLLRTDSDD